MNSSNAIPEANVEDMSNAELFQYLFKAELDTDVPQYFTDAFIQHGSVDPTVSSPSSSNLFSSSSLSSPYSSSSPASSFDNSPSTSSLSYSSPPPYQHTDSQSNGSQSPKSDSEQQLSQDAQSSMEQPPAPTYPVLLPSTSFSYRQISPDMPPSMPASLLVPRHPGSSDDINQFFDLAQTATATTATSSSPAVPPQHMAFFMQRFQQLQQLQQIHHQQQQQFLTSPLFSTNNNGLLNQNFATASTSSIQQQQSHTSSGSPSIKSEKDIIYPSPPMKDDVSMDSDSDDGQNGEEGGSDPLKPSASELKKMTSKERRQLRNKLSARNFRVRRKEYISTLENQVKEARKEAAELQKKLAQSELNCQFLRQELETSRLSQTLFNDGRMSKEHANLLASLLNPNTESFPTSSEPMPATSQQRQLQQQKELMDSINHNNMTILNNPIVSGQPQASAAAPAVDASQGSLQPFVPFDGNWELIVNRAEMVVDPALDPKDVQSREAVYNDLLARYEAAKHEYEVDEQMRTELKAFHEQKLAQTYIVMPKDDAVITASNKASQDTLILQTMVYMMMIHLTRSLFEAATLSNTQIVDVYQRMDAPLRSKMGQEQQERAPCKFHEWRENWIRKCWPSFYNNRQRVCELIKNGLCPAIASTSTSTSEVNLDETVRRMEEGVKGKTVEYQPGPFCVWLRTCITSFLRCPDTVREERERAALLPESKKDLEVVV